FAYRSTGEHAYLAVFAVDDRGRVYWYFPAWSDGHHPPAAIPIQRSDRLVELPEAVRQDLAGDRLWLYAAFVDRPWITPEIEARAAVASPGGPILLDDWIAPRSQLTVRPATTGSSGATGAR